jgi:hypothetical protein
MSHDGPQPEAFTIDSVGDVIVVDPWVGSPRG